MENESKKIKEQRMDKAISLRQHNVSLYSNDFVIKDKIAQIIEKFEAMPELKESDIGTFVIAGRIMALRNFGKACFFHIQDKSDKIQCYIQKSQVGEEVYNIFKKFDIGDIIMVTGCVFRTKTNELTINTDSIKLLTKNMRPLPEKFHGLKDIELRYRQRYIDLIVNPEVKEVFITRSKIINLVRGFLQERDFLEVETPMMQSIPGGATAKPFKTYHNALDMDLYLRIAPELYLKRLLVGGFERVFEINRNFRNEGISVQHNPEFTMVEFYQAYATYEDLIKTTQELFCHIANKIHGKTIIKYQGVDVDITPPWAVYKLKDSLIKVGGLNAELINDPESARTKAISLGGKFLPTDGHGKVLTKLFDILVEPKLINPTFITSYPVEVSPLSRCNEIDNSVTDRFELFITGREMANGFSELNDPAEQYLRFEKQVEDKDAGDEEAHPMDHDYICALEYGMPPAAGEGIGIDRMVMFFTDSASIRDVILFPQLKDSK